MINKKIFLTISLVVIAVLCFGRLGFAQDDKAMVKRDR